MDVENYADRKIPEDEYTKTVRARLEGFREKMEVANRLVRFLDNLQFGEYASVEAFHVAILDAMRLERSEIKPLTSIAAGYRLFGVDWRDYPDIVQYAVGRNVRIPSPYSSAGEKSCLEWSQSEKSFQERCREHTIAAWIERTKAFYASIRNSLNLVSEPETKSETDA